MTSHTPSAVPLLVDSHVHLYACFEPETFLDAAWRNFSDAVKTLHAGDGWLGYLLFTEVQGLPTFDELILRGGVGPSATWSLESTEETASLVARRQDGARLILVKGRQVVTREGIEVLALICDEEIPDGGPTEEILESTTTKAGLSVVPWGFGKWIGARGALIEGLIARHQPGSIYLGDTSSRASFLPYPRQFRMAEERGFRILPGTDPLPFPNEVGKPGSSGFLLRAKVDPLRPADSLRNAIADRAAEITTYRRADSFLPFVRNQIGMQIRKRISKRPTS